MAGPSVLVRVLGDAKGLGKSFDGVSRTAESAGGRMHSAFSSVLGTLNKTGVLGPFGDALESIDQGMQQVAERGKKIGAALLGAGSVIAGAGAGLTALGSKEKAATHQLQLAIEAAGGSYGDYEAQINKAVKGQERYGHSAAETKGALQILTQATGDPAKALQYLGIVSDLAAAKHEDLGAAASQLGRTYNGAAKLLKEFGLSAAPKAATATKALAAATKKAQTADENLASARQRLAEVQASLAGKTSLTTAEQARLQRAQDKVTAATKTAGEAHEKLAIVQGIAKKAATGQADTMTALADKLKGQASAAADTFSGKLKGIATAIQDQVSLFGQKYGPAITAAGAGITALGGVIELASSAQGIWTAVTTAFTAVEYSALLPIIAIIAAVAALAVGIYFLVKNWSTVWSTIKSIVMGVWDWIKKNWPLLVAIILGPFALAAYEIAKHWGTIKKGAQAVVDAIVGFFTGIGKKIAAPFAEAVGAITGALSGIGSAISGAFTGAWHELEAGAGRAVQAVLGVFSGLGGQITGQLTNIWSGVVSGAKSAISSVGNVAGSIGSGIANVAGDAFNPLAGAAKAAGKGISSMWGGVESEAQKAARFISGAFSSAWNSIVGMARGAVSGITGAFGQIWANLKAGAHSLIGGVTGPFETIWSALKAGAATVGRVFNNAFAGLEHIVSSVTSALDLGNLWSGAGQGLQAAYKTITSLWESVIGFVRGVPARVTAALGDLWHAVVARLQAAYGALVGLVQGIIGFVSGIPGRIAGVLGDPWHALVARLNSAYGAIIGLANGIVRYIGGLPGRIGGIAGRMWTGLWQGFKGALNHIIDLWNSLHFKLPKIDWGPIHLGGGSIGVPRVPHLAEGGLITRTGLVFAHAGEAITPAPRTGPALNVENVNLYDGVDVEVFMRKAAWVVATQGV